ncbi:MAG: 23S rRNA (pseudouridine(1915)-N(3))-methyltransferase RlmH [Bacteroidales bacterium]|nr:23S rRNA (pseudouridine(1915)-N(3))-methyltransferase RlmH [Bacteroidales bacterium]
MNCRLINIGKTDGIYANDCINTYSKRLQQYVKFGMEDLILFKKTPKISKEELKKREGEAIVKKVRSTDHIVLLDEKGKEYTSHEFAKWFEKKMNSGVSNICFITGGAFGFSDDVYRMANEKISLSKMTFNHQMVRAFFVEQLYRAFSIINNHPYHNE